jgi:hypothetical protein
VGGWVLRRDPPPQLILSMKNTILCKQLQSFSANCGFEIMTNLVSVRAQGGLPFWLIRGYLHRSEKTFQHVQA